ncbi:MAG: type II/IV secretion system protein [Clostridia bacterium]|jgi:type IV pilus assembly protein PilB|nr:type II/IV secretion system protein [Clostridia bacterium]
MELRRQPIGIELVRRGLITQQDIQKALDYQKDHPDKKMGDILYILRVCDAYQLIQAIGDIFGEKAMLLTPQDVKIKVEDYVSMDVVRQNRAIPFLEENGRIKVCFSDTANRRVVEQMRLLLLNKGLIMEKYITFEPLIDQVIRSLEGKVTDDINSSSDITGLIDTVIKKAIDKRASDIHFEPMEESLRIRYRIDGEMYTVANIEKEKQQQIIGRLKAISNMHQEKQEAQDGRILLYTDYNIRVSSQKNIYGEKFVLRLLKKNSNVKTIFELGFPNDENLLKKSFHKKNSITIVAAPTGEGKTTTLYSVIDYLNRPEINITTIEDPVEIRIPGLNQIEVEAKTTFSSSLRTVLRQDPDIILVGEIRDKETAEIAMQAGQTGHYVLSTIHTIDSIEVITRLRKMGVSNYDIASILATSLSQRLVRKICPHCAKQRSFTEHEIQIIRQIGQNYGVEFNINGKTTYEVIGCEKCNHSGYYDRIGIFEILIIDDGIRELISNNASTLKIKEQALKIGYKPLIVDGINKVLQGITTLEELNKKLVIY